MILVRLRQVRVCVKGNDQHVARRLCLTERLRGRASVKERHRDCVGLYVRMECACAIFIFYIFYFIFFFSSLSAAATVEKLATCHPAKNQTKPKKQQQQKTINQQKQQSIFCQTI